MSQFAEAAKAPSEKKDAAPPTPSRRQAKPPVLQRRAAARSEPVATAAAPSRSNLPGWIKAGTERLSGFAMDDVRVHRNSSEPARIGALAYTKGSDIHLGPGQERHLPHEAWHVVQQKQGRVRATTQSQGVAVNEDGGLEAEADRMGERALAPSSSSSASVASPSRSEASGVVQRKVFRAGNEITSAPSDTLQSYIDDEKSYVLRDDCPLDAGEIHLIRKNKIYVIGEGHSDKADARWSESTKEWTSVAKAVEEDLISPGFPPQLPHDSPELTVHGTIPYDSAVAVFLYDLVFAQKKLELISVLGSSGKWQSKPEFYKDCMDPLAQWLIDYPAVRLRFPADPPIATSDPVAAQEWAAASAVFLATYDSQIDTLHSALRDLAVRTRYQKPEANEKRPQGKAADYFNKVDAARKFLIPMIADLAALLPFTNKEKRRVKKALRPRTYDEDQFIATVAPLRDRAMISRLETAGRPILVKTGRKHAPAIKRHFGDAVVRWPNILPFSWITRCTRPRLGWKRKK